MKIYSFVEILLKMLWITLIWLWNGANLVIYDHVTHFAFQYTTQDHKLLLYCNSNDSFCPRFLYVYQDPGENTPTWAFLCDLLHDGPLKLGRLAWLLPRSSKTGQLTISLQVKVRNLEDRN